MPFVEGFITPIPQRNREVFLEHTRKAAPFLREAGATRIVDAWGDDVPSGKVTDFRRAVAAEGDEVVGFGWMEYLDRAARDAAAEKVMSDPRMAGIGDMPFDGKRMVYSGFQTVVDEARAGGTSTYVDGFVAAVPNANKERFIRHASEVAPSFLREGALRVVECWGEDVAKGQQTDFFRAVNARDDETVIFSWIEWPDKATRDAGLKALEPEMTESMKTNPMPFDGKRMIFGGFEIVSDVRGS